MPVGHQVRRQSPHCPLAGDPLPTRRSHRPAAGCSQTSLQSRVKGGEGPRRGPDCPQMLPHVAAPAPHGTSRQPDLLGKVASRCPAHRWHGRREVHSRPRAAGTMGLGGTAPTPAPLPPAVTASPRREHRWRETLPAGAPPGHQGTHEHESNRPLGS